MLESEALDILKLKDGYSLKQVNDARKQGIRKYHHDSKNNPNIIKYQHVLEASNLLAFKWEERELMKKDYYELLGIKKTASIEEIKSAYRKLIVLVHPDRSDKAIDQIKTLRLIEAYETLSNPERRQIYDGVPIKESGTTPSATTQFTHESTNARSASKKTYPTADGFSPNVYFTELNSLPGVSFERNTRPIFAQAEISSSKLIQAIALRKSITEIKSIIISNIDSVKDHDSFEHNAVHLAILLPASNYERINYKFDLIQLLKDSGCDMYEKGGVSRITPVHLAVKYDFSVNELNMYKFLVSLNVAEEDWLRRQPQKTYAYSSSQTFHGQANTNKKDPKKEAEDYCAGIIKENLQSKNPFLKAIAEFAPYVNPDFAKVRSHYDKIMSFFDGDYEEFLLEVDNKNNNAVHLAVAIKDRWLVKALTHQGLSGNEKNANGQTAEELADALGETEIVWEINPGRKFGAYR